LICVMRDEIATMFVNLLHDKLISVMREQECL
jgi:hypothetical protein